MTEYRAVNVPECTGACCDPVTIVASRYAKLRMDPTEIEDGEKLLDMLSPRPSAEDVLKLVVLEQVAAMSGRGEDSVTIHFECRHFDRESRRCTIYDSRPLMCRVFPNGEKCKMCGGTGTAEGPVIAVSHAVLGDQAVSPT